MSIRFTENALGWLQSVLQERFGHYPILSPRTDESGDHLCLEFAGRTGFIRFDSLNNAFHQSKSDLSFCYWQCQSEGFKGSISDQLPMPGEHFAPSPLVEKITIDGQIGMVVHYDILGLAYWMLSRLEEIGRNDLDNHSRFPAVSSHAYRYGYLERPIVDEWLDILGQIIQRQWPQLALQRHCFTIKVSHDVDAPSRYAYMTIPGLIKSIGRDLLKRKELKAAIEVPWLWANSRKSFHRNDPYNTFEWLMEQSEENGLISAFYFICGRTHPGFDAPYELEDSRIRKLMTEIVRRGHEIGLHPSYNTYQQPSLIREEAERLRKVAAELGIHQQEWGGRMHFFRWDQGITLKALDDAGLNYDNTLGYAGGPGFRCGTCHEYPAYDVANDRALNLRLRPLIAMENSVIGDKYLGLGSTERAYEKFNELKMNCRRVKGTFTLLWHNSYFASTTEFNIYQRLIGEPTPSNTKETLSDCAT